MRRLKIIKMDNCNALPIILIMPWIELSVASILGTIKHTIIGFSLTSILGTIKHKIDNHLKIFLSV